MNDLGEADESVVSSGADGRVLVWALPSRGQQLQLTAAFFVNIGSLPRSLRGKVNQLERETGVSGKYIRQLLLLLKNFLGATAKADRFHVK